MSTAFFGWFSFKPSFRRIIRHTPAATFFVLAGVLCFAVSARAERTSAASPEVEELRYNLESPAPQAPEPTFPPATEGLKTSQPGFNEAEPRRRDSTEPQRLPRETSSPAPPPVPAPKSAPVADFPPVSPKTIQESRPAPAPAPVRENASPPAVDKGSAEKITHPPAPVGTQGRSQSLKSGETTELGRSSSSGRSFKEAAPQWANRSVENRPQAAPPLEVTPETALGVDAAPPPTGSSQEESAGESASRQGHWVDTSEDEDIGYGAVDVPPTVPGRGAAPPGVVPPELRTHVREPEEQAAGVPRDERVPENLGPYAWIPASEAPPAESETDELPWELSADKVTAYNQNSVVDAEGEVFLQHGREYIKADFGRYFADTGWVYLKGNVEIYFGSDRLSGDEAEFDLANKVGWVKNGQVFMAGPHVYLSGERVNKNWGDTYTFRNAKITTCDGDVPAWSLHAEDAVVELDGYARLWGSSLAIKNQKIAYSPYMVVPAKRDRQSGFLIPRAGQDSRKGFYWDQSYYWAVDENQDMTFNAYMMTDRGVMLGAEYRAKREWDENLWMRADYLHDSETWDSVDDNYFDNGYRRTNSERYWLRGMYDGTPFSDRNWKVKANVDYVSDGFFLREFKNDPAGYSTTRDYLEDSFGRTLAPWSSNRVTEGVIYRDWDRITVSAGMRYEQNPYLGNGNQSRSSDVIAQKLPDLNLYLHKGGLWSGLPLEVEGEGQMVYFYRRDGVKGMRYDLNPKLSLPLRSDYGSIIPQAALRGTAYQVGDEGRIQGDTGNSDDNSRLVPEFSVAGFTEFARNYTFDSAVLAVNEESVGSSRWSGMRHSIQPRVDYLKRWKVNQDDLPYFDTIDRLEPRDEIVYSLTNLLTVRRESVVLDKDNNPVLRDDYIDFVRFKLETGYDFDEARRTWRRDAYERRPFMDILADLTVTPGSWFSISSRIWWSPYNGEFTRMSNSVTAWEPGIGRASLGLDSRRRPDEYKRWRSDILYRDLSLLHRGMISEEEILANRFRDPVDLLYTEIQLDYLDPFTFKFQQWYDLRANENQETHLSVLYTHQCFQLEAYMWWDQHDENYGFSIRLPGFWN